MDMYQVLHPSQQMLMSSMAEGTFGTMFFRGPAKKAIFCPKGCRYTCHSNAILPIMYSNRSVVQPGKELKSFELLQTLEKLIGSSFPFWIEFNNTQCISRFAITNLDSFSMDSLKEIDIWNTEKLLVRPGPGLRRFNVEAKISLNESVAKLHPLDRMTAEMCSRRCLEWSASMRCIGFVFDTHSGDCRLIDESVRITKDLKVLSTRRNLYTGTFSYWSRVNK
ncbi:unnamed protein product [Protopolystoma xenopodis]|uniref:Apple domain-containing protein n=1 Tax=Protopolystoma xenopodis TaxID=117903 RepID=A0A448WDX7_9PLAT|nr:unnamed protein product [Protopolystoma xenopodis]